MYRREKQKRRTSNDIGTSSLKIDFILAKLNGLMVCAGDVAGPYRP